MLEPYAGVETEALLPECLLHHKVAGYLVDMPVDDRRLLLRGLVGVVGVASPVLEVYAGAQVDVGPGMERLVERHPHIVIVGMEQVSARHAAR